MEKVNLQKLPIKTSSRRVARVVGCVRGMALVLPFCLMAPVDLVYAATPHAATPHVAIAPTPNSVVSLINVPRTLKNLGIDCPYTVPAGATVQCSATASYSDGSYKVVTYASNWDTSNHSYATVSLGPNDHINLIAGSNLAHTNVAIVSANYAEGGITKSATFGVSVIVTPSLVGLTLACPATVYANSEVPCSANASYSDGSNGVVPANAFHQMTANPSGAGFLTYNPNLVFHASNVAVNTPVSLQFYTTTNSANGKTASATITVKPNPVTGLNLICPTKLISGASSSCTGTASFADGDSQGVTLNSLKSNNNAALGANGNTLTAGAVNADTPVTVTASYTNNSITKTTTAVVMVTPK
jgi:hypothetical protein